MSRRLDRYAVAMFRLRRIVPGVTAALALLGAGAATAEASPTASTPPTVSGTPSYGSTLTCSNGTWSAGAGSFTYQWQLADGSVPIATGATLRVKATWVGQALDCAVTGQDTTGSATATSAPITATPAATSVLITSAREISTATRRIQISGRITPTASADGGAGSMVLYRQTRAGLQQLSFNGSQTRIGRGGTFRMDATDEPTGRDVYIVEYVPSGLGFSGQATARRVITVSG